MDRFFTTATGRVLLVLVAAIVVVVGWIASLSATSIRAQQENLAVGIAASHVEQVLAARAWVSEHAVDELHEGTGDATIRLTALSPLNPDNRPDGWERAVLEAFDSADDHQSAVVDRAGVPVLRYAVPIVTEESCLECHTGLADSVGGIQGALSLTTSYAPFARAADDLILEARLRLGALGVVALATALLLGGVILSTQARLLASTRELERINEALAEQNVAKTRFLATMSHELRTPLNSVIGFSGILSMGMAGELAPEQRKQVGIINSAGKQLLALINDILDLSKVESGRIVLVAEEFAAAAVLEGVVDIARPLAEERGLELRVSTRGAEGTLYSDRRRIEQVLINLVATAIKHTDSGHVSLSVVPGVDEVDFVIEDTGMGINSDSVDSIFEEYHQVSPDVKQPKGQGLGLMISRKLADLLGGEILVTSDPGCGSVFTFRVARNLPELPRNAE